MKVDRVFNKIALLGLTINRGIPLDKVFVFLYVIYSLFKKELKLSHYNKYVIAILTFIVVVSFFINLTESSFQIFYPLFFLITGCLIATSNVTLLIIRNLLIVNIVFGMVMSLLAYNGFDNAFVISLWEKNLPGLYAPYGFSPAVQVYGTFCILVLIISFEYKKFDAFFYITLLAIILTMNRATFVFFAIILFIYKPKIFGVFFFIGCILIIKYWEDVELILFSTSNLNSRAEMRQGVDLSFWQSDDSLVYLFGRGNPRVTDNIASKTRWEKTYIEHGLDFLLHSYGFLGLFVITLVIISLLVYLIWVKKELGLFLISFYYFIIEPLLTHEYLASSFCFVIACILLVLKKHDLEKSFICYPKENILRLR